nr:testis anion transporter 1-like [Odocoileus virginianus texanus]
MPLRVRTVQTVVFWQCPVGVVGRLRVNHLRQVRRARPGIKEARGFGRNGSGTAGVRVHSAARPAKAASGSSARPPAAAREPGEPRDPGSRPGPGAGAAGGGGGGARAPALGAGTTPPSPRVTLGSPWATVTAGCSWHKFRRCLLTMFPFLEWMCFYRFKDWLLGDLLAGISVGLVQIPQAFCASVIYGIFGSCHQMSIGTFFLVSALTINVLRTQPFNSGHLLLGTFIQDDFSNMSFFENYNKSLSSVASVTLLTGIIQSGWYQWRPSGEPELPSPPSKNEESLLPQVSVDFKRRTWTSTLPGSNKLSMGMLGFGFIVTYIPEAAINAYLAATALHVMLSQLTCIFGVMISYNSGPIAFFYNIINYCLGLPKANSTSILLFLTAIVALRINKCIRISFNQYPIEFPMEVFLGPSQPVSPAECRWRVEQRTTSVFARSLSA